MTTEVEINIQRMGNLLNLLTTKPELHNQDVWMRQAGRAAEVPEEEAGPQWSCGTTGCAAGWAAVEAGYVPVFGGGASLSVRPESADGDITIRAAKVVKDASGKWTVDRDTISEIPNIARDWLGLTDRQADAFFVPENTLEDLWRLAVAFTEGKIQYPEQLAIPELPDELSDRTPGVDYESRFLSKEFFTNAVEHAMEPDQVDGTGLFCSARVPRIQF